MNESTGQRIRRIRQFCAMSQDQLAEAAGVSQAVVSKAENDGALTLLVASGIARGLGITIDELVHGLKG
jgi:transcriptional regulator with XRE-family HTH domain